MAAHSGFQAYSYAATSEADKAIARKRNRLFALIQVWLSNMMAAHLNREEVAAEYEAKIAALERKIG